MAFPPRSSLTTRWSTPPDSPAARGGRNHLEVALVELDDPETLPALPSQHLRQSRTLPPDPEEMARPPTPTDRRSANSRACSTSSATTTTRSGRTARWDRATPAHAYHGAAESRPHRHPARHRPLPRPPRPHRQLRCDHPAAQQPAAPHRARPAPRRHPRPGPGPRPRRPRAHHRRRTTPRTTTRPQPGLPTTSPTVNDVARHLCTVSRDITLVPPAGFEPATHGLGNRCSIP